MALVSVAKLKTRQLIEATLTNADDELEAAEPNLRKLKDAVAILRANKVDLKPLESQDARTIVTRIGELADGLKPPPEA